MQRKLFMKSGKPTLIFNYQFRNYQFSMTEWIKQCKEWVIKYRKEIVFCLIIFFVAALSFGLGYLANRELNHAPIIIEKNSE